MKYFGLRAAAISFAGLYGTLAYASDPQNIYVFNIEGLTVDSAINAIAQQSNTPAIFPFDQVRDLKSPPLNGHYTIEQALSHILQNTGLTASVTKDGVITVMSPANNNRIGEGTQTMTSSKKILLSGAAAVSAAVTPIQVSAQTSEPETQSRYALDEIIVSARRVEEGLQEAPLAITAISGIELENRGALDIIDFADAAPNVSMKTNGSVSGFAAAPRTSIRGIGQADFVINTDPAVGLYADGVYLGRSIGSVLDLVDVERVEALRGPQGTLFGRNSTGGAINIISKKPEVGGEFEGYVSGAVGEGGYSLLRGNVNIPLLDDMAIRFAAMKRDRDGFVPLLNPVYNDEFELGAESVWGVKTAFRFEPNDSFTLDLDADYSSREDSAAPIIAVHLGDLSIGETGLDDNRPRATTGQSSAIHARRFNGEGAQGPGNLGLIPDLVSQNPLCGTDQTVRDTSPDCLGNFYASSRDGSWATWFDNDGNQVPADDQSLDTYGFSARLNWDVGPINVKTISSWRGFDASFKNGSPAPIYVATNDNALFEQDQMSHEITLSGDISDRISWLAGAFYQEEDGNEQVQVRYPLAPPNAVSQVLPLSNISDRFIDNSSKAVYGQLSADITDRLELTLGARQTEESKEVLVNSISFLNAADSSEETVTVFTAPAREASETNLLANLSYDVMDDIMVYAQYSDGFRNGGFPARAPNGVTPAEFLDLSYDEEFVTSYEAGFKSTILDGKLRINAAAFLMDFEDYQVNSTTFIEALDGVFGSIANVGDVEIRGVEAEGSFLATDNLRFDFTVGYLNSELTSINEDPNTGLRQFILNNGSNLQRTITEDSGVRLPNAPELQLSVGANYSLFLGNGAEIRNRADVFYESDQYATIGNYDTQRIPSTTRVNYNASYFAQHANWEFTVGARNLLDAEDITNAVNETSPRAARYHVLARGREAYVQFKLNFGE